MAAAVREVGATRRAFGALAAAVAPGPAAWALPSTAL